jgi:hypothetical protein
MCRPRPHPHRQPGDVAGVAAGLQQDALVLDLVLRPLQAHALAVRVHVCARNVCEDKGQVRLGAAAAAAAAAGQPAGVPRIV